MPGAGLAPVSLLCAESWVARIMSHAASSAGEGKTSSIALATVSSMVLPAAGSAAFGAPPSAALAAGAEPSASPFDSGSVGSAGRSGLAAAGRSVGCSGCASFLGSASPLASTPLAWAFSLDSASAKASGGMGGGTGMARAASLLGRGAGPAFASAAGSRAAGWAGAALAPGAAAPGAAAFAAPEPGAGTEAEAGAEAGAGFAAASCAFFASSRALVLRRAISSSMRRRLSASSAETDAILPALATPGTRLAAGWDGAGFRPGPLWGTFSSSKSNLPPSSSAFLPASTRAANCGFLGLAITGAAPASGSSPM